jgi:transcriptional regulator with XRE-family HTH domain
LPVYGGNRRVAGLRREEVAMLAGMSIDYYIRLERGNLTGASDSVIEALARALKLDDAETAHLFDLARAATAAPACGASAARRQCGRACSALLMPLRRRRPGSATTAGMSLPPTSSAGLCTWT